ncbi:unnamed protein product [Spodoptera littoralis]|uniref:Attractin n=1 Tax=Spodoptera littoralis TaxID=7109 RepID=A0A9P0N1S0_SPOLI|nr:unnamed protein product [Spodoptera littoralis]CAH1641427.1 unnamed protein product [Spodoptera littoralis]
MVESLQMFLFLFKSKYRRKCSWFSPFLCSVLIVLLFCDGVLSKCGDHTCVNGVCKNDMCVCYEGWQGPECQYCGGKVNLTSPTGFITDGPGNYSVSTQCSWLLTPPRLGPTPPPLRVRLESFATECGWDHLYVYDGDSVRAEKLLAVFSRVKTSILHECYTYLVWDWDAVSSFCEAVMLAKEEAGRVRQRSAASSQPSHREGHTGRRGSRDDLRPPGVLENGESSWTRQVIARSGSALLHFFSDDAYAMEGFNVTYAAYSCPSNDHRTNCSNHGECEDGSCRCEPKWTGVACDEPLCPEECNAAYGGGTCTRAGCACSALRRGIACARDAWRAGWAPPTHSGDTPPVAAHVLLPYKTAEQEWEVLPTYDSPAARFAHSAVLYGHELIVYGGVVISDEPERGGGLAGLEGRAGEVTNEIWRVRLNSERPQWHNATPVTCSPHRQPPLKHCGGLHVSGHTAVLVYLGVTKKPVMLVFFGHSPHYGYLHLVQEYYVDEGVWAVAATRGWAARAGFGHAAAWDPLSRRVYLHGGLVSESEATQAPSASLFEYDPELRLWRPLQSAPTPRYLHTATFITPGVMLVFGGNAHNDSAAALVASPAASKCYSAGALLYDVRCGVWWNAAGPRAGARAAHAAAPIHTKDRRAVLIHAGFDGRLRSDALIFEAGEGCGRHASEAACLTAAQHTAVACVWRARDRACLPLEEVGWKESFDGTVKACLTEPRFGKDERRCSMAESCAACTAARCAWCGACYVSAMYCVRHTHQMALSIEECGSDSESPREACGRYHSCAACLAHQHHHTHGSEELSQRACFWDYDTIKCKPVNSSEDIRSVAAAERIRRVVPAGRLPRVVDVERRGRRGGVVRRGARLRRARVVRRLPRRAGVRLVRRRRRHGPRPLSARRRAQPARAPRLRAPQTCYNTKPFPRRWHFTACPVCQCNGHSVCAASGRCVQPCAGRTVGDHCDQCAPGHWGSPYNGGVCQPCECNAQAVACAADTGRCYCSTKGLAGDRCDKCDNTNHYHADVHNKGACYSRRGWPGTAATSATIPTTTTQTYTTRAPATVSTLTSQPWLTARLTATAARRGWPGTAATSATIPTTTTQTYTTRAPATVSTLTSQPWLTARLTATAARRGWPGTAATSATIPTTTTQTYTTRAPATVSTLTSQPWLTARVDDLAVDYQFTFNLSKKEDRHLSAINFRNAPVKPDVDADFSITCSAHARMNLSVRTRSDPTERLLFSDVNCTSFRFKFAKSEHAFGVEDNVTLTTFFVYVYDFRPPLWIQISFSQYPKLNLQQFFITFSSCFLLLLLVAAALWKIKQKYDMYRRRQRLFVEMEQMASRPFSQVSVELEKGGAGAGVPAPVALEPCRGGRAAVLSLLVRLPTGGTGRAPPLGGLAVASALVTLGHHAAPLPHHKRPRHH